MIGKIIEVDEDRVILDLQIDLEQQSNLINSYVLITDQNRKLVGEITGIKSNQAIIKLIGEYIDDTHFVYGINKKPSFQATIEILSNESVKMILSSSDYQEEKDLIIGKSAIYENIDVSMNINQFFGNHFAIFGSTGSGKSCGVARIIQNLYVKRSNSPLGSNIIIFDAYGEYHQAFENLNKVNPQIGFKKYTTNVHDTTSNILKLPLWLLSVDDIALLLGATNSIQIPLIEKAMKLVTIFSQEEEIVLNHKNDIIARAILDILSSGKEAVQIRDQVLSVLSRYNTRELNSNTEVYQIGYTRPIKQCLNIDKNGAIQDIELVTEFIKQFIRDDLMLTLPDGTFRYTLKDLLLAFDFALISEGILKSDKVYDQYNSLRLRLGELINSDYNTYFNLDYISKDDFIKSLFMVSGRHAQIINFNINYVDDRFAKVITKIYAKILFDYAKSLEERASTPINIILEEAHRYVQNDNDINLIGYNIFDRITKEGRKYGVLLGLISQRPSELSSTAISQCNNFLIFKMLHPTDISFISEMLPNISDEVIRNMKILPAGTCIAFGLAFKIPVRIKMDLPDPTPSSSNCNISKIWFEKNDDLEEI